MVEATYVCSRCKAICTDEDAVIPAEYPAGWPIPTGLVTDHICPACWEDLGFIDEEER